MNLEEDIHNNLPFPSKLKKYALVRGSYLYYHYKCDGVNDAGWGCAYRTLQTICSWIVKQENIKYLVEIPSINDIQTALVKVGDKPESFINSRQWIGSLEISYCIDYFYKILCRILHCKDVKEVQSHTSSIFNHFQEYGSPIMMGGDRDCSSKGILGICETEIGMHLLILDPHCRGPTVSKENLQCEGWIKWLKIDDLDHSSFYNLCYPLLKAAV
ncbi:hypothetical protein JTE90_015591 [Oedothorax gibbosus]|uniref:UFSP1/2/DUB catalytic domain-containing protein n=1 Tax=Oedothorax gibbosus TaxID=931172 RepID=A0AAV6TZ39_9ARAC|nr:hypothetical protein JTE90_015591 [Oedothorax gibbosus]